LAVLVAGTEGGFSLSALVVSWWKVDEASKVEMAMSGSGTTRWQRMVGGWGNWSGRARLALGVFLWRLAKEWQQRLLLRVVLEGTQQVVVLTMLVMGLLGIEGEIGLFRCRCPSRS